MWRSSWNRWGWHWQLIPQFHISYHQNQRNNFECCNLRRRIAASFAQHEYTQKLVFNRCVCFATLSFIFLYKQGVPKKWFILLLVKYRPNHYFQYPSMLDEKNNGFTALTSYQNIQKVTISVSFLVQKVMGGSWLGLTSQVLGPCL